MIERRIRPLELREEVRGSKGRQRWATAVTYRTVDSYGTIWTPGVFTEALSQRMPTILYGHDWYNLDHVLGQGVDFREADYGVDVLLEWADPEQIPAARTAMYLTSGDKPILKDVSVGFERHAWRSGSDLTQDEVALGAREAIDAAGMDELSIVVRGAVTGASLRTKRGTRGVIDIDAVVAIAQRKSAGELTEAEAQEALDLLTSPDGDEPPAQEPAEEPASEPAPEVDAEAMAALEADADAALGAIDRW